MSVVADQMRCLVTGATGYIGGRLAPGLIERGHAVRAMARTPDKLADAPWRDRAEVVRGDLGDPDSLTSAFEGTDVVYYLVHSMGTSKDFVAEEARAAHNVVTAAKARRGWAHRLPERSAPGGWSCRSIWRPARPSATSSSSPASKPWCCRRASSSAPVRRPSR